MHESLAGFRTIAAEPGLRLLVGLLAAQTFIDGVFDVLIVVFALDTLDIGAAGVGFLNSAAGIGGLAAAVVAGALAARGRLATDFGFGLVLWGLPILLIGVWPEQALALVLLAVIGAGGTIASVTATPCSSGRRRATCSRASSESSTASCSSRSPSARSPLRCSSARSARAAR